MLLSSVHRFAVLLTFLALTTIVHADYVGPFTETWSDDGDVEGWAGWTVGHDDVNDRLTWIGFHGEMYATAANMSFIDTPYLGDLTGANSISFDLGVSDYYRRNVTGVYIWLEDTSNTLWEYDLGEPVTGENSYTVILNSPNWIRSDGDATLAESLASVQSLGIFCYGYHDDGSSDPVSGWLDNFGISDGAAATTPEPGTMTLVMLGLGSLGYLRRRKSSAK